MISQETKDFYIKTKAHLDSIIGEEIFNVFYRFDTAHILFNRLFDEVPQALENRRLAFEPKFRNQDSKRATILLIQLLGAENIFTKLNDNHLFNTFEELAKLIELKKFYITFNRDGIHIPEADLQLYTDLQSKVIYIKILAIYVLILRVRNNRQHARKQPQEHQRLLLDPLTQILKITNEMLFQNLSE